MILMIPLGLRIRFFRALANPLFAILLTASFSAEAFEIPPCSPGTERHFLPSSQHPIWASCKDKNGLYQGLLLQFSGQTELIRVAAVKDSLREGREIRFGRPGQVEERTFRAGHLEGRSWIFSSNAPIGRVFPKKAGASDWAKFTEPASGASILHSWTGWEPLSSADYKGGRLSAAEIAGHRHLFTPMPDGRIKSTNHPEMSGLFFPDPEALWDLNAADLKAALTPGFGSCKKYAGPIGRFTRDYDVLLFKRLPSEKKHLERLNQIRNRLIEFCVPKDLQENLGALECPPLLPSNFPPRFCLIPVSDQVHNPYDPKFFKFEFSLGYSPEALKTLLQKLKVDQFLSDPDQLDHLYRLTPEVEIQLKKTPGGVVFAPSETGKAGMIRIKKAGADEAQAWWEWKRIPGL